MYEINFLAIAVAALVPTVLGFFYYHKNIMGGIWMRSLGKTEEELQDGFNMPVAMIVGYIMSFFLAFVVDALVEMTHKTVSDSGELIFGSTHTFGHGAYHGMFLGLLIAMPVLITNGIFERKSWSNMLVNVLFWVITIAVVAGIVDAWV